MKARIAGLLLMAGVFLAGALPAKGYPVTIYIEAVVDSVDDRGNYLEGKINPGDPITGWYTYDSDTLDSNPSIYIGMYEHHSSSSGIKLSLGGFVFQTDQDNVVFLVSVGNAGGPYSSDNYLIRSYNNLPLSNGTLVDFISWQLDDPTGNALSSDALPTTPPVLDDWQSIVGLRLEGDRAFLIDAHVTSAIPEPATILLFSLGGGWLLRKRG